MNCPDCGTPVEQTDRFCPKCYARIEPPGFWRRLFFLFLGSSSPKTPRSRPPIYFHQTTSIKTVDADGTEHQYQSLAEAPLKLQQEVEKMQKELSSQKSSMSVELPPETTADTTTHKFFTQKSVSVYKIIDDNGQECTYNSLEELPPEIRAAFEQAMKKPE